MCQATSADINPIFVDFGDHHGSFEPHILADGQMAGANLEIDCRSLEIGVIEGPDKLIKEPNTPPLVVYGVLETFSVPFMGHLLGQGY